MRGTHSAESGWRRWLLPPAFADPDEDRRARLVYRNVLGFAFVSAAMSVPGVLGGQDVVGQLLAYGAMVAVALATLTLVRVGRPNAGARLFCIAIYVAVTLAAYAFDALNGIGVLAYALLVLTVGLFWSGRAAMVFSGLSAASALAVAILRGWSTPAPAPTRGELWITLTLGLAMSSVFLGGALSNIQGALDAARAAERRAREEQRLKDILQLELEESRRLEAIGRLASGIAHDFNNMLTIIVGNATYLLEQGGEAPSQWRHAVAEMNGAGARATLLVRQLLTFARAQKAGPGLADVDDVLRAMEPILRRLAPTGVTLEVALDAEGCQVTVDATRVEQVVLNLVTNGYDAMPKGGTLKVTTSRANGHGDVEVVVKDGGTGMDDETRTRIFEPFFTTKGQGRGTGLGLATVHGIVSQAGGTIAVESEVGKGSQFRVRLPGAE